MSFNFNPKKKENLTPIMKQVIAQLMQVGLLEEVCSANTWTAKDLVFQGGTSIHLLWNSPRLSEDLDFIVSIDKTKEIDKILNKSLKTLQRKVSLILPETQLRLKKYQRSEEELHNVIAYDVVWTQPQKIGAVKVKLEFYITKCDLIEKYNKQFKTQNNSFIIRTTPELNDLDIDSLISDTLIPVATPESIYADKIVALAKRDYLKFRDFFDLWWLNTVLNINTQQNQYQDKIMTTASLYSYSKEEIVEGLKILQQQPLETIEQIEKNLKVFLPEIVYKKMLKDESFKQIFATVMSEASKTVNILDNNPENNNFKF
jgi:hypothetical protein